MAFRESSNRSQDISYHTFESRLNLATVVGADAVLPLALIASLLMAAAASGEGSEGFQAGGLGAAPWERVCEAEEVLAVRL